MPVIGTLLIGIAIVLLIIGYRLRRAGRTLHHLEAEIEKLAQRQPSREQAESCLAKMVFLLQKSIQKQDDQLCYQAIDLLKTAYAAGLVRENEIVHIVRLAMLAIHEKKYDLAGALTDASRLLLRRQTPAEQLEMLQQLERLAAFGFKEKQNFIAAKAADLLFSLLEKASSIQADVTIRAIAAIRAMGALTIRRRDPFLLREVLNRLADWQASAPSQADSALVELIAAWLHRALSSGDPAMFEMVRELVTERLADRPWSREALRHLATELGNLAGAAALNPFQPHTGELIRMMLNLGAVREDLEATGRSVKTTGEIARAVIQNQAYSAAFPILVPLLDAGRKMLSIEMKFGGEASLGGYRQRTLFLILRECLAVMEFAARKRMTATLADVIDETVCLWQDGSETRHSLKSFKKFCALLLLYYGAHRRQKALPAEWKKACLALFNGREQERLNVFIGGIRHELLSRTCSEI